MVQERNILGSTKANPKKDALSDTRPGFQHLSSQWHLAAVMIDAEKCKLILAATSSMVL